MNTNTQITDLQAKRDYYLSIAESSQKKANALDVVINILKEDAPERPNKKPIEQSLFTDDMIPKSGIGTNWNTGTVAQKAINIIKLHNRFMVRSQIEKYAEDNGAKFDNIISVPLSGEKKRPESELTYIQSENVWGLKSWVNESGNIKDEYRPIR